MPPIRNLRKISLFHRHAMPVLEIKIHEAAIQFKIKKKSAAVTGKSILFTAKHLARNKEVNARRSLNQVK